MWISRFPIFKSMGMQLKVRPATQTPGLKHESNGISSMKERMGRLCEDYREMKIRPAPSDLICWIGKTRP